MSPTPSLKHTLCMGEEILTSFDWATENVLITWRQKLWSEWCVECGVCASVREWECECECVGV